MCAVFRADGFLDHRDSSWTLATGCRRHHASTGRFWSAQRHSLQPDCKLLYTIAGRLVGGGNCISLSIHNLRAAIADRVSFGTTAA